MVYLGMFHFDEPTMEKMTLSEALEPTKRLHHKSLEAVQAMAKKIPETQHELFYVVISKNQDGQIPARSILNVALTPDDALEAMNKLRNSILPDDEKKTYVKHLFQLAISHELGSTELVKLRQDGTTGGNPDRQRSYGEKVQLCDEYPTAPEHYKARGIDYQGSYLLQTALGMGNFSYEAKRKLDHVASAVPLGVRDAFTVDLVKNAEGKFEVESFAISPNVLSTITGITIRHHQKTMELPRATFDRVADKLEKPGHRIA